MRQRSYALPSFDRKEPLVTLSLEELQEISQEGLFYGVHKTPFGNVVGVVFQNRLCGLVFQGNVRSEYLVEQAQSHLRLPLTYYHAEVTAPLVEQVFAGETAPLLLAGTPFQIEVWKHLLTIPKGQVLTYQELAKALGKPQAMRSVGQALKANPIAYVFPCHRVVSSSGKMGGYRWGTGLKEKLLASEGYEAAVQLIQERF
ncbi:MAG: methylated-DNA--[protein]-cysteine S-methyltransferase [Alphaproteobacteria bacterium]